MGFWSVGIVEGGLVWQRSGRGLEEEGLEGGDGDGNCPAGVDRHLDGM